MRVLIAFDKFKNSMTAHQACQIASDTIAKLNPDWEIVTCPLADGGEGFCQILTEAAQGELVTHAEILGPHLQPLSAHLGYAAARNLPQAIRKKLNLIEHGEIAIIEMAQASGIESVPLDKRDPWIASTYGTGQLIAKAAERGVQSILLGVGGSATNDIGLGALEAIGLELVDKDHQPMQQTTPTNWDRVLKFSGEIWPHIPAIQIACDVNNPLIGPMGSTRIFGPQKGLKPEDANVFEKHQGTLGKQLCRFFGQPETCLFEKGVGAAGGIAFGLRVACDANLVSGFDLVEEWLELDAKIKNADIIITGEGRFDASSLQGKGPGSILQKAQKRGKSTYIFAGSVQSNLGLKETTAYAISSEDMPLETALEMGPELLVKKVEEAAGLLW